MKCRLSKRQKILRFTFRITTKFSNGPKVRPDKQETVLENHQVLT
jgi:hypothetical protein